LLKALSLNSEHIPKSHEKDYSYVQRQIYPKHMTHHEETQRKGSSH